MIDATADSPRRRALLFVLFAVALSWVFRDAVAGIVASWGQEEYSYGYLIPLVTLVLLLNKMETVALTPENSWTGFAIVMLCVVFCGLLETAGIRGILPELYIVSLVGAVAGFWGVKSVWALAAPLGFMIFCAPLPKGLYYNLSLDMQMLSTSLGTAILDLLGVPVFQDGNIIDLGGYRLQVAEACSGLRYLFPLMSLSYLFAYVYKTSWPKRVLLFLSALPIAVAMNSLRIAIIGVTVDRWGQEMAEGFIHEFEGWVVFLGCTLCLVAEIGLMQRVGRKGAFDYDCLRLPKLARAVAPAFGGPARLSLVIVVLAALASSVIPTAFSPARHDVPLRQSFAVFPMRMGPWIGRPGSLDPYSLSRLGTNDYLLADYSRPGAAPVNLYALYYTHQDSSSNEAVHTPAGCIPAGGWTIDSAVVKTLRVDGLGAKGRDGIEVNKMVISKNGVRQVVYYWYLQGGEAGWGPNLSKLYQIRNAITKGQTSGAMIRVMTQMIGNESEEAAERRMLEFMNVSIGPLNEFMFPATSSSRLQ